MAEVISVRFRGGCKTYDFSPGEMQIKMGDQVVVETSQGPEFATCTEGNHEIPESAVVKPLCSVVRMATDADRRTVDYNRKRESEAFDICEKKILDHGLEMKLVNVSASFDGSKIIFFFTADGRVDFRELVRDLAGVFRARIELRQIGVRDEAKMVGGLGICGRPFCCSQFLDGFLPVSIKMAKTQNLSLNPTKISGTCGRLMCCLKYEQEAYEDAVRRMPKAESFVQTPDGPGNVKSVNLLKETMKVSLDSAPETQKNYHNCEVCVLRNGKGGRDGIEIPDERPARYVEESAAPAAFPPIFAEPLLSETEELLTEKATPDHEAGETKARRHHRGGRRRNAAKNGERPVAETGAEEKPASRQNSRKKPNGGRKDDGAHPGGGRQAQPIKSRPASGEGTAQETGEAAKRRRPHHRGGRRHRGGGNGGNTAE